MPMSAFYYIVQFVSLRAAFANNSCQVYPSEYAYQRNSVYGSERSSANCRPYAGGLEAIVNTHNYDHCDGTQLRLTDSDLGSEQYSSSDYYVWNAGSSHQLLFIFPTRVNLTTITMHYYRDNVTGLSRLRFFAVPDDFNVWDAPVTSYGFADVPAVPPGGEPAGRRNVSVNQVNFSTRKILLYKSRSDFQFAMSETEFFTCGGFAFGDTPTTTILRIPTTVPHSDTTSTTTMQMLTTRGQ